MRILIIVILMVALASPAFAGTRGNADSSEKARILNMYKKGDKVKGYVICPRPKNSVCSEDGKFYTWQAYAKRITGFTNLDVAGVEYVTEYNRVTIYYYAVK
ncbi:MAG: hypothetical protein KAS32_12140 [Candidatus Peribacteraceae bacterium]|nr:hypothetical protein [Candidatus Peribacteraceae bacterium]